LVTIRQRAGRASVLLLTLPTLVWAPAAAEVILIHTHGDHSFHPHAVSLDEIEHRHPDQPRADGATGHASLTCEPDPEDPHTILIVPKVPVAVASVRLASGRALVDTPVSSPLPCGGVVCSVTVAGPHFCWCSRSSVGIPRADRTLDSILLSNHALLL